MDPDGASVAGAQVGVEGNSRALLVSGDGRGSLSGADGRFHLAGVLAGQWSLTVSPPDASFESTSVPLVVPEGGGGTDVGPVRVARPTLPPRESDGNE